MRSRIVLSFVILAAACAQEPPPAVEEAPRPVTVIELREMDPVKPLLITGTVQSWKEQGVSFEVEGPIRFIVERGTNVEGRWVDQREVKVVGSVLARLDPRVYEIARDLAATQVVVAEQRLKTAKVELAQVLPARKKAAQAESKRAHQEWLRSEQAYEKGAVTEVELIQMEADRDAQAAKVEEVVAEFDSQRATIQTLDAKVREAEESLRSAEYDLERCTLYAPFSGEISAVTIEAGGYARRGQAVANLVMMQPIEVEVAVSAETVTQIRRGDVVQINVAGDDKPVVGAVYDKSTSADPKTRTFNVSIMTSNRRIGERFPANDPRSKLPKIRRLTYLNKSDFDEGGMTYFTEATRALQEDPVGSGNWHIWVDPSKNAEDPVPGGTVLTLRKYKVVPGDRQMNFQGLYLLRSLTDIGELNPRVLIPLDVPRSSSDEQKAVVVKPQWMMHPGQLVQVLLSYQAPAPGLYLPIDAIKRKGEGRGVVFVAKDGRAQRIEVRIGANVGGLYGVQGEGLVSGAEVITDYLHFLQDNEAVRITRHRKLQ